MKDNLKRTNKDMTFWSMDKFKEAIRIILKLILKSRIRLEKERKFQDLINELKKEPLSNEQENTDFSYMETEKLQ